MEGGDRRSGLLRPAENRRHAKTAEPQEPDSRKFRGSGVRA